MLGKKKADNTNKPAENTAGKTQKEENTPMSPAKKAFSIASTALMGVVFVLVLVIVASVIVQAASGKTPNVLGYKFYSILTDSMVPTLNQRDLIVSKVLKHKEAGSEEDADLVAQQIKAGDIVTFVGVYGSQAGMTITHRCEEGVHWSEEYERYCITTRGDKEGAPKDPEVPVENVVAVMVRKADFFKDIYNFFISSKGIASMISVPLGLMLLSMIARFALSIKLKIDAKKHPETEKPAVTSKESVAAIAQKAVEEYIKQQAIEEYKAKVAAEQAAKEQTAREQVAKEQADKAPLKDATPTEESTQKVKNTPAPEVETPINSAVDADTPKSAEPVDSSSTDKSPADNHLSDAERRLAEAKAAMELAQKQLMEAQEQARREAESANADGDNGDGSTNGDTEDGSGENN